MIDCDFSSDDRVCPHCGFRAGGANWRRNCPGRLQSGVGSILARWLKGIRIKPAEGCACLRRQRELDIRGPDWCAANLVVIVGWLREEAGRRGLPFIESAARLLVRRAIAAARLAADDARQRQKREH